MEALYRWLSSNTSFLHSKLLNIGFIFFNLNFILFFITIYPLMSSWALFYPCPLNYLLLYRVFLLKILNLYLQPSFFSLYLITLPIAFLDVSINISKTKHITVSFKSEPSITCGVFTISYVFLSVIYFSLHLSQKCQLSLSFTFAYPLAS